ncbi:MAG: RluA family pseudouridine synthase [Oscillospiraceae bacterium]|nr:RluA family pseudouridine synthase [Oscillospiraceae bacterium]
MQRINITKNDSGQRLDKFLQKSFPLLGKNLCYKAIRTKRVKVNNRRSYAEQFLHEGDILELYINDEYLIRKQTGCEKSIHNAGSDCADIILYEDENILIADKPQGVPCHSGDKKLADNLINRLHAYLYGKGEYGSDTDFSFKPALCNRIDRNTSGLVILAKNSASLREINERIRTRQVRRFYLCLVQSVNLPEKGSLKNYYRKDETANKAIVREYAGEPENGETTVECKYHVVRTLGNISLLEIELITGKSHQIRAQLAAAGAQILGDVKYGACRSDKSGYKYQALCAYKLVFDFQTAAGVMDYLRGRSFETKKVPFNNILHD